MLSSERKIYVVGGDTGYANWCQAEIIDDMAAASLVMWTGGEDIIPELYGKKKHPTTGCNRMRDAEEVMAFRQAQEMGKPCIGICRGSQLMAALSGAILVQDSSHPHVHRIATNDGKQLLSNSSHHQQQYPFVLSPDKYELIAWALDKDGNQKLSPYRWGESYEDDMSGSKEAEIVYYKETNALGIQGHPEWLVRDKEDWAQKFISYCQELIEKYLRV